MNRIQYEGRSGRFPRNDVPARFDGASYAQCLASIHSDAQMASVVFSSMTAPAPAYPSERKPASPPRNRQRSAPTPRLTAADIYGPLMRGKGYVTSVQLSAMSGRNVGAVNSSLTSTLLPDGKVQRKRVGTARAFAYHWKWIGS